MKLNNLKPIIGFTHSRRRIDCGSGPRLGGTSTRGHKGIKSCSGYKGKIGFEGGQTPLQRRVPKAGFKNTSHEEYFTVDFSTFQAPAEKNNLTKVGVEEFKVARPTSGKEPVKVFDNGELKAKLEVSINTFSEIAGEAIKAVGDNTTIIQANEKVY